MNESPTTITAYELLSEQLDDLKHIEVMSHAWGVLQDCKDIAAHDTLFRYRLQFMQNYLNFFFSDTPTPRNPLGYPDPMTEIDFHMEMMEQIIETERDLKILNEGGAAPTDILVRYKENLIRTVDDSLDCRSPEKIKCLHTQFLYSQLKLRFPALNNEN